MTSTYCTVAADDRCDDQGRLWTHWTIVSDDLRQVMKHGTKIITDPCVVESRGAARITWDAGTWTHSFSTRSKEETIR